MPDEPTPDPLQPGDPGYGMAPTPDPLKPDQVDPNWTGKNKKKNKKAENKSKKGVGGGGDDPETQLTILRGKDMEWFFDSTSGKWYVRYGLPDSERSVVFEAGPDQMDALFGQGQRPQNFTKARLEKIVGSRKITFAGNIAEMEGEGRFEDEVRRIKALALDNGALPDWAEQTGEVLDIIYIAQSEGKSQEWVVNEISRTQGFKDRFPGIKKMQESGNLTLEQAITGFLEFEAGVRGAVKGIGGNIEKVTPEVVGGLLNKGYNIDTIVKAVSKFDRVKKFRPALQAFNSVLRAQGKDPMKTLQDMFDFISGTAPADVYDLWEASSVAEAASAAGLGHVFSAEDAIRFARETEGNLTLQDATGAFQSAAQMLLRLRHEVDVGKFGLNMDDVIDLNLGRAPRSGVDMAEVQEKMNRAVLSAQANLQGRANPFTGFTSEGTPQKQSLSGLRSAT